MDPSRLGFALAFLALATPLSAATLFDKQEVSQSNLIILAQPLRGNRYTLLLLQQLAGGQQCWRERGDATGTVDMLLLNFDFTGSCERATDSNGYSLRLADEDLGLRYRLQIVNTGDRAKLMAVPYRGNGPTLLVGQTSGAVSDFMKIQLESGWRLTQRVYQGKVLSHYYFTHNSPVTAFSGQSVPVAASSPAPLRPPTRPSSSLTPPSSTTTPGSRPIPIAVVPSSGISASPLTPITNRSPALRQSNASGRTPINLGATSPAPVAASNLNRLPPPPTFATTPATQDTRSSLANTQPRPTLRPLVPSDRPSPTPSSQTNLRPSTAIGSASAPRAIARSSPPQVVDVDANGQLGSSAYLVMIPARSAEVQSLIQQLQELRVPPNNLIERRIASRTGVAVGPFPDRQVAERWRDYLLRKGVNNAQVYFGR